MIHSYYLFEDLTNTGTTVAEYNARRFLHACRIGDRIRIDTMLRDGDVDVDVRDDDHVTGLQFAAAAGHTRVVSCQIIYELCDQLIGTTVNRSKCKDRCTKSSRYECISARMSTRSYRYCTNAVTTRRRHTLLHVSDCRSNK